MMALMQAFSVFALGYLARPLGGIFSGHLSDKYGRKMPLTVSIFLMALATLGIGFLPTYQQIGTTATVFLVIFRLLQGFSVGGEISSSVVFLKESPINNKMQHYPGLAVGFVFMSMTLGNALATVMGYCLTHYLSPSAMLEWGWRVPFMCGFIISIIFCFIVECSHF